METSRIPLAGKRVLVVEDQAMVAREMCEMLEGLRCRVVGPVRRIDAAIGLARREALDAALLDVDLGGREVYPVADELLALGVPFVFATGYEGVTLPSEFRGFPRLEKPFGVDELARAMAAALSKAICARGDRP